MLLEWVDYYGLLFLAPFLALEFFWRARRYEVARGWRWRAAAVTLAVFGFTLAVGRAWGAVLPQWSLVDGAALGAWGGAAVGILVYEFLHYWYHRLAHKWNWLWRLVTRCTIAPRASMPSAPTTCIRSMRRSLRPAR